MPGLSETIKKADLFPQNVEILFENGKHRLQSHCGVVFGFIMVALLILFGYMKAEIMLGYKDNTIQEPEERSYFPPDYYYG